MPKGAPVVVFGQLFPSRNAVSIAYGIRIGTINHRMRIGMTIEQAVTAENRYSNAKKHPLYVNWNSMISRCYTITSSKYRGKITVCDRWRHDFWLFVEDMGMPPEARMSIDRIDNDLGYFKENCRWATLIQQRRNQRNIKFIECFGKKQLLTDWAKETGIHKDTLGKRIKRGMPIEDALTLPPISGGHNLRAKTRALKA